MKSKPKSSKSGAKLPKQPVSCVRSGRNLSKGKGGKK